MLRRLGAQLDRLTGTRRGAGLCAAGLALLGALIYLPYLGSYPLWDPWEPHYSQVAWEMSERGTWLNPHYRGADNWWSKPIFMLWMLRLSLGALWEPLRDFAGGELAGRLPFALAAIAGGVLHYDWVRRLFGNAVGVLAGVVLLTTPQYLLIGRQIMADTPFVVAHTAALGYLAVGLFTPRQGQGLWRRYWPFAAFWGLQAIALLTKGFVPPVLAALVLLAYAVATFRWRDYAELTAGRRWLPYLGKRLGLAALVLGAAILLAALVPARLPSQQRGLYQAIVLGLAGLGVVLGVFFDLPPSRHLWHLLRRIHAGWGLALFFLIGAPWYAYMTFAHGWPFWNEFIFYHHLGRAAGTIDKPAHPFEFYVRQLGFGLFPWSAFLLGALGQLSWRANLERSLAERRNFFVLLCALLPYLFFTLSGTKFAHYVFPVLPFAGVLVAAALLWLGRTPPPLPALAEDGPPLGPPLPPAAEPPAVGRGELVFFAALALVSFGILAQDLAQDFRYFLRLFIYYQSRATPLDYQPFVLLQVLFAPIGIAIGTFLLSRQVRRRQLVVIGAGAVVLSCYLGWVTMPAMAATFSYEPLYHAYQRLSPDQEPIAQYNNWQQPERSVIFLFQNRAEHLKTDKLALAFLQRPGRKFVIVDKDRLAELRRLAATAGLELHVVSKDHPYARLLSDVPSDEPAEPYVLRQPPSDLTGTRVDFGDAITLLGWKVEPHVIDRGQSLKIDLYFRANAIIDRNWELFVHGDGPRGSAHRLHGDHFPVEGRYLTHEWQPGEIVRDSFELEVPHGFPHDSVQVWLGFYIGEERLPVSAPGSDDNRARGPLVRVRR